MEEVVAVSTGIDFVCEVVALFESKIKKITKIQNVKMADLFVHHCNCNND